MIERSGSSISCATLRIDEWGRKRKARESFKHDREMDRRLAVSVGLKLPTYSPSSKRVSASFIAGATRHRSIEYGITIQERRYA